VHALNTGGIFDVRPGRTEQETANKLPIEFGADAPA
jgi:hypothetical protein